MEIHRAEASLPSHAPAQPLPLLRRACLAPLAAEHRPDAQVALCLERIAALGRDRAAALADRQRCREEQATREWRHFVNCYETACFVLYLEDAGLLGRCGVRTAEGLLGSPGEGPLSAVQMRKYLRIARFIQEEVALSRRAGVNLLDLVARTEDPACIELCGVLILGGQRAAARRGAAAALCARRAGRPEEALACARAAADPAGPGARPVDLVGRLRAATDVLRQVLTEAEAAALIAPEVVAAQALLGVAAPEEGQERRRTPRPQVDEDAARQTAAAPVAPADIAKSVSSPLPAAPPERTAPHEVLLPVPYPEGDDQPTEAERHACGLLVCLRRAFSLCAPIRAVFNRWDTAQQIDGRLQLHVLRSLAPFERAREALLPELAPRAAEGRAELATLLSERAAAGEVLLPADLLPVPMDAAAPVPVPMTYLSIEVLVPFDDAAPTDTGRRCAELLALLSRAGACLAAFQARFDAGDPVSLLLCHQLKEALLDSGGHLGMLASTFQPAADVARAEEQAAGAAEEVRALLRAQAEARLVVAGEDQVPAQHTTIGLCADLRPLAVTQTTGQVLIACGPQGCGKTQVGVLLSEGANLHLPGLGRLVRPGRSIVFLVDFNRGRTSHQHLRGLYPNPYPAQWRYLREHFQIGFSPSQAAFPRIKALCLPGTAARYRAQYPEACERGLSFCEIGFHPSEQGSLFYRLLLSSGCEGGGRARSQWRAALDGMIGYLGEGCDPDRLLQEFLRARLPGANVDAVRAQLRLIKELTQTDARLIDHLHEPVPLVVLLESAHLGPGTILPLEVAMIHALSGPLPDGQDPLRWFILHELGKQGQGDTVGAYLKERAAEVRHRPCSFFLETQLITSLPPEVVSLSTGLLHFRGTSLADYRKVQELYGEFRGVPFEQLAALGRGMAYGAFRRATDPSFTQQAQPIVIRPSAVWAGGETVAVAEAAG